MTGGGWVGAGMDGGWRADREGLFCVSHKAASVCDGTEGQGTQPPRPFRANPAALSVEMQPRLALIMSWLEDATEVGGGGNRDRDAPQNRTQDFPETKGVRVCTFCPKLPVWIP